MDRQFEVRFLFAALTGVCIYASLLLFQMTSPDASRDIAPRVSNSYTSKVTVTLTEDAPRKGKSAKAFKKLLNQSNYYAAFATGPDGKYGWSDNYASQSDADLAALNWCERASDVCQVIARIAPVDTAEIDGVVLSKTSALAASRYRAQPGAKALALSESGAWGMAWSHKTKASAVKTALANCASSVPDRMPSGAKGGACRIIWID